MLDYYKENIQFYFILLFWVIVGIAGGPLIFLILPLSVLLMMKKEMYQELLLGFFFILILSDSELDQLDFAKNLKVVYLLLLTGFLIVEKSEFQSSNFLFKIFIPFFLVALFCLFFTETFFVGFQKSLSYIIMFILIPKFFTKLYRDKGVIVLKNIVYFGTTILLFGFILFVIHREYVYNPIIHRYMGVFGNPNGLGLYCFLLFTFYFTLNDIYEGLFSRNEKIFIYIVMLSSIVMSNSRNGFMSVAILILFDRFFQKSVLLGFIVSFILVLSNIMFSEKIPELIKQFGLESFFRLNTLQELSGRAVAWEFAWKNIQNNYFIGKGFGYDEFLMRANYRMLGKLGTQGGVHSSYLSLWLNFGLIGLITYLRSFFLVFFKSSKTTKLGFSIMYAVLFASTFEGLFIGSLNPQMIILLMTITVISDDVFIPKDLTALSLEAQ
jgi:hypothetical protein